jgi:hypothetical protein
MNIIAIIKAIGSVTVSLFPIIFPNQKFKPLRALFVAICILAAAYMNERFGTAGMEQAIDVTSQIVELTTEAD